MLYTFACNYLFCGGAVIQVYASNKEKAVRLIREYKIPAYGEDPEYYPFEKLNFNMLSAYSTSDINSEEVICIYEFN